MRSPRCPGPLRGPGRDRAADRYRPPAGRGLRTAAGLPGRDSDRAPVLVYENRMANRRSRRLPIAEAARHSDTNRRVSARLNTRDIAEQVAVLYWPQVLPDPLPGVGTAVELRQLPCPGGYHRGGQHVPPYSRRRRGNLVAPDSPAAARALSGDAGSVEVTVAEQPLLRLQVVESRSTLTARPSGWTSKLSQPSS